MAARVRTHLLFDMERNVMNNECSVMSNRRSAPFNNSSVSSSTPPPACNASFNLCGFNLRNDNRPRAQHRYSTGISSRITGGFESSDHGTSAYMLRSRRCVPRSESEKSDEVHLMTYDTTSGKRVNLWEDQSASSPMTSDDKTVVDASIDKPTAVKGRMYSRKRYDENPRPAFSSPEFNGSRKLGAVPKRRAGSTSTTSNRSSLTSSTSSDFFVIPKHLSERFVPIGNINLKQSSGPAVSMMEVADPKLCIVLDMIEARDLPEAATLSPGSLKPYQQRALMDQMKCLKNVMTAVRNQTSASDAMLLMNMESNNLYPFITYIVVDTQSTDSRNFSSKLDSILSNNIPQEEIHCLAGYEEVATIAKAPMDLATLRKPITNATGFIISMFKVFAGEDSEKLERSWLMWTGARTIYKQVPPQLGLRRITFHKKRHSQAGGLVYVLICECIRLQEEVTVACGFVSNLRARCCGYTAIYRPIDVL